MPGIITGLRLNCVKVQAGAEIQEYCYDWQHFFHCFKPAWADFLLANYQNCIHAFKFINTDIPPRFTTHMLRTQSSSVSQTCSLSLTLETLHTCSFAKRLVLTLMGSSGATGSQTAAAPLWPLRHPCHRDVILAKVWELICYALPSIKYFSHPLEFVIKFGLFFSWGAAVVFVNTETLCTWIRMQFSPSRIAAVVEYTH